MKITCPYCQQQTNAGKHCQECGSRLPLPSTGGNTGDIVATRGTVIAGSTVIGSDAIEALTASVTCPICGRRILPADTFDCRKCGRQHICVTHQNAESYWCHDCIVEARRAEKARIRATFRRTGADRITVSVAHGLDMEFCRVPAGEFLYGDRKERRSTDEFWIGKAPVATSHFLAFVRETARNAVTYFAGKVAQQQLNHPAKCVSWYDAQAWCEWAAERVKAEIRLPTEMEWEKAARGTEGREYPWGYIQPTNRHANFGRWSAWIGASEKDREKLTTPIGKYSPMGDSPFGLVDVAGNVWEWCADWKDATEKRRVLRGGSFYEQASDVSCTCRGAFGPEYANDFCGFRVILCPPTLD